MNSEKFDIIYKLHMLCNRNQAYFHQSLLIYIETLQLELVRHTPFQQIGVSCYVHYQFQVSRISMVWRTCLVDTPSLDSNKRRITSYRGF